MKTAINWINTLSRTIFRVGIIDLCRKAQSSRLAVQEAETLASNHEYMDALYLGEGIIDRWYPSDTMIERQFRRWFMSGLLDRISQQLGDWESQAQNQYDAAEQRGHWLATEGRFAEALMLLEPVNQKFYNPKGQEFLDKLRQIIAGRNSFQLAVLAEQGGDFAVARNHYENATTLSPEWAMECRIRLGIIAIKTQNWAAAIDRVAGINNQQAAYIRAVAYTQQRNYELAQSEWDFLADGELLPQEYLQQIDQNSRNFAKERIQQLVDAGNFPEAKLASEEFLQQFGDDTLVQANLTNHILPHLQVNNLYEEQWLEQMDITSLHNWALGAYHKALANSSPTEELIVAWSTALANLHLNPRLQTVPWLGDKSIDLAEVYIQLKQRLENLVNDFDAGDGEEHQRLQELYRLEVLALDLMGSPPTSGLRVRGLFLTPGCYWRYRHNLAVPAFPSKLWGTLYTDWWQAIVAFEKNGDILKAMRLEPQRQPSSAAEEFAHNFLSYHQGCYYLQITPGGYPRWRSAVDHLKQAQSEIRASVQWSAEIDRLCQQHYQALWDESDRREFTQFWYELVGSQTARNYMNS
ncbi:MAG: hypothetical protein QNJ47_19270 [Nostocaceae cyanobacterium]|nr:hypothetical protein [Nostocaceae cyanobacterium]